MGVKVAILGKPNAGKSSLLNALLNYDKAIVSDIAGTTRDAVDGEIDIDGVRFLLTDTAGIRESEDRIESIGVERALKIARTSDICLVVLDSSLPLDDNDRTILEETKDMDRLVVVNKSDLGSGHAELGDISVSALTEDGIEELKKSMFKKAFSSNIDFGADLLTEERHQSVLKRVEEILSSSIASLEREPLNMVAIDIHRAWSLLGEITGETANEDIIDEIFSRFCVGK